MVNKHKFLFEDDKISQDQEIILRSFFPDGKKKMISEIVKRSDYSYERVNSALKELEKKKIVKSEMAGKTLIYTLDFRNLYSRFAFSHYMLEEIIDFANKHFAIYKAVEEIKEKAFANIILIFGSYSKGLERKDSDIDIMVVSDNKKKTEEIVLQIKRKYGLNLQLVFVEKWDFKNIKKENRVLWEDLKINAKVFEGRDTFYYWMYQNEEN